MFQFFRKNKQCVPPTRGSECAVGYDLCSAPCFEAVIHPGDRILVPTGLTFTFPPNTYGQIMSRSGCVVRYGLVVLAGTIDPDYRGEVSIVILNVGEESFKITGKMKLAQMILLNYTNGMQAVEVGSLNDLGVSFRGSGGFGSTGF